MIQLSDYVLTKRQRWFNVVMLTLGQRCNTDVGTTLWYWRWDNVVILTLIQCWNLVVNQKTTLIQRWNMTLIRLSNPTNFQRWSNVEIWLSTLWRKSNQKTTLIQRQVPAGVLLWPDGYIIAIYSTPWSFGLWITFLKLSEWQNDA